MTGRMTSTNESYVQKTIVVEACFLKMTFLSHSKTWYLVTGLCLMIMLFL
jgi:hypothetical protein